MVWLTDVIVVCEAEYPQSAPVNRPVVVSSAVLTTPTTVPRSPPTRPPSPPSRSACAGGAAPAVRLTLATARRPAARRTRMAIREVLRSATSSPHQRTADSAALCLIGYQNQTIEPQRATCR